MKKMTLMIPLLVMILLIPPILTNAQDTNEEGEKTRANEIESQLTSGGEYKVKVDEQVKEQFKSDIRELLDIEDLEDYEAKSSEIRSSYDAFFDTVIEHARVDTGTDILNSTEVTQAKNYIFIETIKDEKYKKFLDSPTSSKVDVDSHDWFGMQTVDAACPATTHPNYKQLSLDIDGGSYGGYQFNGGNDLYLVLYRDNPKTCERTYTLSFLDEDHPHMDEFYDELRVILYDRSFDIESFKIINNNMLKFDGMWSSSNDYDCLFGLIGCHESATKSYTPGQTIYVSNTWNHMMDTSDTNRSLPKVSMP